MERTKILVVDDEPDLCNILKFNLEENGFDADIVFSAEEALKIDILKYQLILLDIMMDTVSGFEMLSIIRNERNIDTPVIFITAMDTEQNLIHGFNIGAEDYIKKPFSVNEVIARVKAVINRNEKKRVKGLLLDSSQKQILINNNPINFTRTEYDIFNFLALKPGRVYSRDEIIKKIRPNSTPELGRTIDVNITRMRKKLGAWGSCIATRLGYGYFFDKNKFTEFTYE